jgi:hypothetical protein
MKAKFLLTLLALTGLFLSSNNSAFAATGSPTVNNRNTDLLSQTISKLIDLDRDAHSLVSLAIDRALLAQRDTNIPASPTPAGGIPIIGRSIVNGKVAQPNPNSSDPPVLINGITKKPEPQDRQTENRRPRMINGRIINPDRQE